MSVFSPVGSSTVTAEIAGSSQPSILNFSIANANTEYSVQLPQGTRSFLFKLRENADLKVAYTAGTTALNYFTLPRGCSMSESALALSAPLDLFFQSPSPGQILELTYWT